MLFFFHFIVILILLILGLSMSIWDSWILIPMIAGDALFTRAMSRDQLGSGVRSSVSQWPRPCCGDNIPCTAMISLNSPVGPLLILSSLLSVAASVEVDALNKHQWLTSRLFQDCSLFRKEYCNLRLDKIMMLDTGLGSPADCQVNWWTPLCVR